MKKLLVAAIMLLMGNSVAQADENYNCIPGPPAYHEMDVLSPGQVRVVDFNPNCTDTLGPENYMQLIIGVATPDLAYIKVTGQDFLEKVGIRVELIDAATGSSMFDLVKMAGGQVCRYASGTSYEFLNPQLVSPAILRPVRLRISNVGHKSYFVHSTVTWVYKPEGAPVSNCSTYGGSFM
jgi:hypothetical protein